MYNVFRQHPTSLDATDHNRIGSLQFLNLIVHVGALIFLDALINSSNLVSASNVTFFALFPAEWNVFKVLRAKKNKKN